MKKYFWLICIVANLLMFGCKGNGSTGAKSNAGESDSTTGINDGTGAPGSGTGSAGAGTVGDTTRTPQDTVNGAPAPQRPDTPSH
jgi:hypothetical protein